MLAKCLDGTEIFKCPGDLIEPRIKGGELLSVVLLQFDFSLFCWNENEIHKFLEAFTRSDIPSFYDPCL